MNNKYKHTLPIPRDAEKDFSLLEIQYSEQSIEGLIVSNEIKEQLEQIIKEFKNADILATYNLQNKKKILLCGKPGTGKTFSAQIISSILNIPLLYINIYNIIYSSSNNIIYNLIQIFNYIESGVWIVLFNEFDIIGKDRDDSHEHGEIKRVVNNFLQMLDNLKGDSIILAATNHQYMLDSAIWRRFDEIIYYELPDEIARKALFEFYLRPMKKDVFIDFAMAARITEGLSPSDIKMIAEEAMKISIINSKKMIEQSDIKTAIQKFMRKQIAINVIE